MLKTSIRRLTPPPEISELEVAPRSRVPIGRHTIVLETSDVVRLVIEGDISADDVLRMLAQYRLAAEAHGYVLVMADVSRLGSINADARKALCAGIDIPMRGTVIYNASFQARILSTLVTGALQLFTGAHNHPVVFLPDEAEAQRWIAERRTMLGGAALAV
ncbi:STAS/SEC14 domain-containing protein [Chondromyces apiculatus]|uniref:STAS/SEC14 domain-containing protein n=1 Tax=Chondromyces apiculatus DSM 436 TaxID=1192034 RepID=A0A017T0X6_9BACT|nr:STAS/SEC14 domain-containing protein [Chondromyces apiculatus]EYF02500.1 Hypothetical protein CAP_7122 [Chondromyces apiculatus DSM 436]